MIDNARLIIRSVLTLNELDNWRQPLPDAIRLINAIADQLLCVRSHDGTWRALMAADSGIWHTDDARLRAAYANEADIWMADFWATDTTAQAKGRVAGYLAKSRTQRQQNEMIAQIGPAIELYRQADQVPEPLAVCNEIELDTQLSYLGTPAGALDLRTGETLDATKTRKLLITQSTPDAFDPDASHADATQLLAHLSDDIRNFTLQALGYALRGRPRRRFYVARGAHSGGKTTLLGSFAAALGPYMGPFHVSAIQMQQRPSSNAGLSPELEPFMLPGRIAFSSDSIDGMRLSRDRMKSLSGGDAIIWRRLNEGFQSSPATATMILFANTLPQLGLSDTAVKDRAQILPWAQVPESQRDPAIGERLANDPAARQALLAMIVNAALEIGDAPPEPPAEVRSALDAAWSSEIGEIGEFLLDAIEPHADLVLTTDDIWRNCVDRFGSDDRGRLKADTRPNRRAVIELARELAGLGSIERVRVAGRQVRAWRGWRFVIPATADMQQLADREPQEKQIPF